MSNSTEERGLPLTEVLRKLLLCSTYILVSSVLIRFNKVMMQPDHFPFALALSCSHMVVASIMSALLYAVAPSRFPAMEGTKGERMSLMKWFVPIGVCFSVMLFGSNKAYVYCSVTLLQFMKEANVIIVFLISCAVGLQSINRIRVVLLVWVIASATVSVSGDMTFSKAGIAFQACSQVAECIRVVLGEFVLSGRKLDPLTYTAFVAPTSLIFLSLACACTWDPLILPALLQSRNLVLLNGLVAFVLNVMVAMIIKEISAVGFILTGLTKDVVIVSLSCIVFGDPITRIQCLGFVATLIGIGFWSLLKIRPNALPVQLMEKMLCVPKKNPGEDSALLEKGV
mmetsp:Transcript_56221/g.135836  ORF Transcript_56221/g.135836 Transcript_56221/m.135836 type:complete len:341 (-) Transcript_56221:92-1114(-)